MVLKVFRCYFPPNLIYFALLPSFAERELFLLFRCFCGRFVVAAQKKLELARGNNNHTQEESSVRVVENRFLGNEHAAHRFLAFKCPVAEH